MKKKWLVCIFVLATFPLLSMLQPKQVTVFMIGDSTMADKPYSNGNPEKGWGQVFPLYFREGIRVENHAVNGRSSKSFRTEGRWAKVLENIRPGDYVVIEFGHNDQKKKDASRYAEAGTDYRENLTKYIRETREKGGIPLLATPIVRRRFDENGEFYDTHGDYPEVVREVAAREDVPLLDLHKRTEQLLKDYGEERSKSLFLHIKPGEYGSLPEGKKDNTHLSANGAFRVCDLAVAEIRKSLPKLAKHLKE